MSAASALTMLKAPRACAILVRQRTIHLRYFIARSRSRRHRAPPLRHAQRAENTALTALCIYTRRYSFSSAACVYIHTRAALITALSAHSKALGAVLTACDCMMMTETMMMRALLYTRTEHTESALAKYAGQMHVLGAARDEEVVCGLAHMCM